MSYIRYQHWNFQPSSQTTIDQADAIMREYKAQGYDLTLRQLYYQFVARGLLPNKQTAYKRLGDIVSNGRLAGLLDWDLLVDRTREEKHNSHWNDPSEIIATAATSFQLDKWEGQENYVEVWVEKEALAGVVKTATEPLDVTRFSCRGYVSQSAMWQASNRFREHEAKGRKGIILHLGDHDPSGIDMTRDIAERLRMFKARVKVKRIALNMNQIEVLKPVPNPTKMTDARAASYVAAFGYESWELDALEPVYLDELITSKVQNLCDLELFEKRRELQEEQRKTLTVIKDNYDTVVELLQDEGYLD
jgi:hypothetical protein